MSSSAYPIIWALKHAPVIDAEERAILLALADHGDADGCNCFPSVSTMARVALVSVSTVSRKLAALQRRGIIRRQPGPPPPRWQSMPEYLRPVIYELMIPFSWWSDAQRDEVDRMREDRGRPPLTPAARPNLPPAPPKKTRADKGRPAPQRRRKAARTEESPAEAPPVSKTEGAPRVSKTGDPLSTRQPPSVSETDNPPVDLPVEPSSSYVTPATRGTSDGPKEEGEGSPPDGMTAALRLVDSATALWSGHRLPTDAERRRLAERAAAALAEGASPDGVRFALTRDLGASQVRTTAVQVVMGRTRQPGWADALPPAPAPSDAARPPWCGRCDERTRLHEEAEVGAVKRCPDCHPLEIQAHVFTA